MQWKKNKTNNKLVCARQRALFYIDHNELINHIYPRTEAYYQPRIRDALKVTPDEITPGEICTANFVIQYSSRKGQHRIDIERGWIRIEITGSQGLLKLDGDGIMDERVIRFKDVLRTEADVKKRRLVIPITIETNHTDDLYPWALIRVTKSFGYQTATQRTNRRQFMRTFMNGWPHQKLHRKLDKYRIDQGRPWLPKHTYRTIPGSVKLYSSS